MNLLKLFGGTDTAKQALDERYDEEMHALVCQLDDQAKVIHEQDQLIQQLLETLKLLLATSAGDENLVKLGLALTAREAIAKAKERVNRGIATDKDGKCVD